MAGTENISGNRIQVADGERQLGGAADCVIHIHFDMIGRVYLRGGNRQLLAVQVHDGIGRRIIIDAFLGKFANIICENYPPFFGFLPGHLDQKLRVALGGCLYRPGINPVGPDTDQAPATAGAKRDDLVKGIQQKIPPAVFN